MKTKIRKSGIFAALTAALLVTAALIASCSSGGGVDAPGYQPPPNMGYTRISIGDDIGRSIAPTNPTSKSDFTKYNLVFKEYASGAAGDTTVLGSVTKSDILPGNIADPIPLNPVYWEVTVIAFIDDPVVSGEFLPVAVGTSDRFKINIALKTDVSVDVSLYDHTVAGATNGTFKYTVTLQPGDTFLTPTLDIKIDALLGGGSYGTTTTPASIGGGGTPGVAAGTISLPPGYYVADIILTTGLGKASVKDVLHVYQNLTSEFTYLFTEKHIVKTQGTGQLDVDFKPAPSIPVLLTGTPTAVTAGGLVTLNINSDNDPSPAHGKTETLTVANSIGATAADDYKAVKWYLGSDEITAGISGTGGNILTITAGTAPFAYVGTIPLTVVGTDQANIPHSFRFNLEIENVEYP